MDKQEHAECVGEFVGLEIEIIQRFLVNLSAAYAGEVKRLDDLISKADDPYYVDYLGDQQGTESEVLKLGGGLAMVGLYRIIELSTKGLLRPKYKNAADKFYQYDRLVAKVKKDLSVDIQTLTGSAAVNEIRLINNAVKHDGKVSKELARRFGQQSGWKQSAPLTGLEQAFGRLSPAVPGYLTELAKILLP